MATITKAGFRDILEIADARRYSQYAINIEKPDLIVPRQYVLTIVGHMAAKGRELAPLNEAGVDEFVSTRRKANIRAVAICLLHATRLPRHAGVRRILVPKDPGVGSAVGFLFAPVSFEIIRSFYTTLQVLGVDALAELFDDMFQEATSVLRAGAPKGVLSRRRIAFMHYKRQGREIQIDLGPEA